MESPLIIGNLNFGGLGVIDLKIKNGRSQHSFVGEAVFYSGFRRTLSRQMNASREDGTIKGCADIYFEFCRELYDTLTQDAHMIWANKNAPLYWNFLFDNCGFSDEERRALHDLATQHNLVSRLLNTASYHFLCK